MIEMLWIPVAAVFIWRSLYNEMRPDGFMDWMMHCLGVFLFTIICSLPAFALSFFIGYQFKTVPVEAVRYHLIAIRDKDGVVGQFFLGSGSIKGDQYYFYYRTNTDGSVTPDKVYAGQGVRVYEEDRTDAELVEYDWVQQNKWAWLIGFPANHDGWSYKFYVPKGTVRTGFTM